MEEYYLLKDGDYYEKKYWGRFIKQKFPSYEKFWQKYIVPITNRPKNIHIKTDIELKKIGKSKYDVQIAQLHYTVLRHLIRANKILDSLEFGQYLTLDKFVEFIIRICAATDVADELLERFTNKNDYKVWDEEDGKNARFSWRNRNKDNLKNIREYRNYLLHCPLLPTIPDKYPKIDLQGKYCDWRTITHLKEIPEEIEKDFDSFNLIAGIIWLRVLYYLEDNWKRVLKETISEEPNTNEEYNSKIKKETVSGATRPPSGESNNTVIEDFE